MFMFFTWLALAAAAASPPLCAAAPATTTLARLGPAAAAAAPLMVLIVGDADARGVEEGVEEDEEGTDDILQGRSKAGKENLLEIYWKSCF